MTIKTRLKEFTILIKNLGLALVTLISFISCSSYINYLKKEEISHIHEIDKNKEKSDLYCSLKGRPKYNIIHESNFGKKEFVGILKSLQKMGKTYSITELGLLYTLYNSFVRPDATNWNSRLQFFVHQNGKSYYYDFHNQKNNFQNSIYTFKKLNLSTFNLKKLLTLASIHFPRKFTVQKKFSAYLERNQSKLLTYQLKKYFRLGKPLQKGETFYESPKNYFLKKVKSSIQKEAPLFKVSNTKKVHCNFDSKLYDSGIFIIHKSTINENLYAIVQNNGNYIMIATSADNLIKAHHNLGQSTIIVPKFNIPLCSYSDKEKSIISMAYQSRDSGQLLYHLNQYQYYKANSLNQLIDYTSYARHLFLTNPSRMLYESKRGSAQELNHFLSLNFPVYHSKVIGLVQSVAKFPATPATFVEDDRSKSSQSCIKSN